MATSGQKRPLRSPRTVDGSGNNVMAELQERLKGRKGSAAVDRDYAPMKAIGRSKSDKISFSIQQQSGGLSGRTKWHIQPPSYKESLTASVPAYQSDNVSKASPPKKTSSRLHGIPPPPKTPPPVLANRIRNSNSGGEFPKMPINRSASSAPVPSEREYGLDTDEDGYSSESLAVQANHGSNKAPLAGSKSVGGGGVKDLARLFNAQAAGKSDQLNKVSSEPKDLGTSGLHHSVSDSSVLTSQSLGRGRRIPGGSSSSESEFTSSADSCRSYQNIFEDEAFVRFNKRPKQSSCLESSKAEKKPKPLPRKSSASSLTLKTSTMKSTEDLGAPTKETSNSHPSTEIPSQQVIEQPPGSSSMEEVNKGVDAPRHNPLVALETEIDLFMDIANLPSRLSQFPPNTNDQGSSRNALSRPKAELNKALSHNPGGNVPITRRNSPQVIKELRNGVCSDGDQDDSDTEDDYIRMGSSAYLDLTATLQRKDCSSPTPIDPRSSGYYLKILPSYPLPPDTKEPPKSPGDTYIRIEELENMGPTVGGPAEVQMKPPSTSTGTVSGVHPVNYSQVMVQGHEETMDKAQRSGTTGRNAKLATNMVQRTKPRSSTSPRRPLQYKAVVLKGETTDSNTDQREGRPQAVAACTDSSADADRQLRGGTWNFTDRPLPPLPPENPYYNTLQNVLPSPLTAPKCRDKWHAYVEIDEEEIDKMAATVHEEPLAAATLSLNPGQPERQMLRIEVPPEVPERPDHLDTSDENESSGEYSYAAIPGQTLFGFKWMKFHARNMAERSPPPPLPSSSPPKRPPVGGLNSVPLKKVSPPRHVHPTIPDSPPPTPPPKTESLLREVSLIPAYVDGKPSPYISPIRTKNRKMSAPEIFALSTGVARLPPGVLAPRRETSSDSKQLAKAHGKRKIGPSRPKEPPKNLHRRLKVAKPLAGQDTSPSLPQSMDQEMRQRRANPEAREHQKVSRQRSHSSGEISVKRTALRQSKSYTPQHPPSDLPTRKRKQRRTSVQKKIDRRSLAIIMQNKQAISQQLSIPSSRGETNTDSNPSMIRTLGDILLELDTLLRHECYTEQDLISAIEHHFSITLQTASVEGASPSSEDSSTNITTHNKTSEDKAGQPGLEEVEITEQDVEDVVNYMDANQCDSPQTEANDSSPQSPRKPRSETIIICDDSSSSDSRGNSAEGDSDSSKGARRTRSKSNPSLLDMPGMRDGRSHSIGNRGLRRANAKRRPSAMVEECLTGATTVTYNNGTGLFTHKGGKLMNIASGVEIDIPEGAIQKGKNQRVWFDVLQPVCDLSAARQGVESLVESYQSTASGIDGHSCDKHERWIQLSPIVLIGPCDAVFQKPIKVKIPHCLPYRNNSWHLHMLARAQNSKSEDWLELPNSTGLIMPHRKHRPKFFRSTTYQMHLQYSIVRTKHLGSFKLTGTPVGKGAHAAKRMLASVYMRADKGTEEAISLEVFMTNSIFDHVQTLHTVLSAGGYDCLEMNVPILCFGDGRDMELTLSSDTNATTPLATKMITFGAFWRLKEIGQPRALFTLPKGALDSSRMLTLKLQQAGSKFAHETNFIVP